MKAAVYKHYGPPEVVSVKDIEKPKVKADEILLKIHASTVNRTDCGFRSAQYFISRFFSGLLKPNKNKQVLGNEFAGEVEAIGENVKTVTVGDKLFGFNDSHFGAHAEYVILSEKDAFATLPINFSYEEAAALTEGGHYALSDIKAANIQSGQKTLVNGATGAIGSAAVQLLKFYGAEVTAVCAGIHHQKLIGLGADAVIDYKKDDFTNSNNTYDFIFDAVGKSSFKKCKPILKEKGIYISTELGKNSANVFLALITQFGSGKKVLFPIPQIKKEDVEFLKTLAEQGKYRPLIDRSYPLDDIQAAYRYVESGEKIGNVILKV